MAHLFLSYLFKEKRSTFKIREEKLQSEEESDNLPGKVEGFNFYRNSS